MPRAIEPELPHELSRSYSRRLVRRLWLLAIGVGLMSVARALEWRQGDGFQFARLPLSTEGRPGFRPLPPELTGVDFANHLSLATVQRNINLMNGSGLALGDYDGDGLRDIYFCRLEGPNALYRNLGEWRFADVTEQTGVACDGQLSTGAVFADIDGDGDPDLLVTSMGGPNACFLNDGKGGFRNVTEQAGIGSKLGGTSMALADVDGDGDLDLYLVNYGADSVLRSGGRLSLREVNGRVMVRGRHARRVKLINGILFELGEPDVLYLNDGKGRFSAVPWTGGAFRDHEGNRLTEVPRDQGLSVMLRDMNGDGAPDIFVANDASTPDRYWLNDGAGRFRLVDSLAVRQTSYFSMNLDAADVNRDGHMDFLVCDMLSRQHDKVMTQRADMHPQFQEVQQLVFRLQSRRNVLLVSNGDGTYAEMANFAGLAASEWTWGVAFMDVDLDGWEDLLVCNGFVFDVDDLDTRERIKKMGRLSVNQSRETLLLYPPLVTANLAFRNQRDLTFSETGREWGFDSTLLSQGIALADLDNDGDQDVVINSYNAPAQLLRNESAAPRLAVRLRGAPPNTRGIGAKVIVEGGPVRQSNEITCGGRYMSGDDTMRVFAAGQAEAGLTVRVVWRSGRVSSIENARANHVYLVEEASASSAADRRAVTVASSEGNPQAPPSTFIPAKLEPTGLRSPLFEDVSHWLDHRHVDSPFDDLSRQGLLPRRLDRLGSGLAWMDWNDDGLEDLIVGGGRGGRMGVFLNRKGTGFEPATNEVTKRPMARDATSMLGFHDAKGALHCLVGSSNYEDGLNRGGPVLEFPTARGILPRELPGHALATGPMALADIDADGDLDLFVGGRCLPGRYPEPASSRILLRQSDRWVEDQANTRVLDKIGMVGGAVFSDLDGDGDPDLLLACEWGPIRFLANERGRFLERTSEVGLADFTGWWNGINVGDFNNDGRLDIVAANWGRNTPYEKHRSLPLRIYYGDLDDDGILEVFEAYYNEASAKWMPIRDLEAVTRAIPHLREYFPLHGQYARAGVDDILRKLGSEMRHLEANTLESVLFVNTDRGFEPVALPWPAQLSPAFAVCVSDFDADGHEDLFLSQNFFAMSDATIRFDAGRGLLLQGNGRGEFAAVHAKLSGIEVYGQQRGAAAADFDADGRVDLAVVQNGAPTRLFRNRAARRGLRVLLEGNPGNPRAVGARIGLVYESGSGPVREIHAGAGYWSQDGAVAVLGKASSPRAIRIRWPDGRESMVELDPEATEVRARQPGSRAAAGFLTAPWCSRTGDRVRRRRGCEGARRLNWSDGG